MAQGAAIGENSKDEGRNKDGSPTFIRLLPAFVSSFEFLDKFIPKDQRAAVRRRSDATVIGQVLRMMREKRKMSQADVARRMGLKQPAIARLERQRDVKLSTFQEWAAATGGELVLAVRRQGKTSLLAGCYSVWRRVVDSCCRQSKDSQPTGTARPGSVEVESFLSSAAPYMDLTRPWLQTTLSFQSDKSRSRARSFGCRKSTRETEFTFTQIAAPSFWRRGTCRRSTGSSGFAHGILCRLRSR